ncbi:MAG: hypothetical protein DRI90_11540 [Deltaproteobacteria bacterium]|nr:MAG: hypothetical protein DRI90_11540 [Deltaproteobacteria bacterium]
MKSLRSASLGLLAVLLVLAACQKNDQSSIKPETLAAQSSATSGPSAAESSPAAEAVGPDGSVVQGGAPGPLAPFASGQRPSALKPAPGPTKATPVTPKPTAAAAGSAPEVKLIKPGAEPRRELRLTVKPGQTEAMKMTMTMAIGMKLGAKSQPTSKLPPMIMDMAMKIIDVRPNGDFRYEFSLTGTDVAATPGVDPKVQGAIKQALGQLKGLSGWAVVSNRGISKEAKINVPPGADAQTKQVMQGMEQAMQQMGAPLPEEPVGLGAQWQVITKLSQNGIQIGQTATYDMVKLAGDALSCKVAITQHAPKQKVPSPLGVTVDLLSMKSTGAGTTDLRLTKIAPVKSQVKVTSLVKMGMPKNQIMEMNTTMQIDMASR